MRILIIDDNEKFCRELEQLVQSRLYLVAWCTSGTHGLERALEEPFDLLITNTHLDDGSGTPLWQRLRESLPELPVLVLNSAALGSDVLSNTVSSNAFSSNAFSSNVFSSNDLDDGSSSSTAFLALGSGLSTLGPGPREPRQLLDLIQKTAAGFVRAAE